MIQSVMDKGCIGSTEPLEAERNRGVTGVSHAMTYRAVEGLTASRHWNGASMHLWHICIQMHMSLGAMPDDDRAGGQVVHSDRLTSPFDSSHIRLTPYTKEGKRGSKLDDIPV